MKNSTKRLGLNQNADPGATQRDKQNSGINIQKRARAEFASEKNNRERGYSKQPQRGTNQKPGGSRGKKQKKDGSTKIKVEK